MTNTSTDIISGLEQYADSEGPRIDLNSLYDDGNNEIVLLGVGNILLTDEGLGVHVVKELKESFTFTPAISIIDGDGATYVYAWNEENSSCRCYQWWRSTRNYI